MRGRMKLIDESSGLMECGVLRLVSPSESAIRLFAC
jgi:hypothetical protein